MEKPQRTGGAGSRVYKGGICFYHSRKNLFGGIYKKNGIIYC
jgi:hypothetical protein